MDFRDEEVKQKIIRFMGYLARGDVNGTDIDEWGASGQAVAQRLSKCLMCKYYGIATAREDGVGPECTVDKDQALISILGYAWGRCPINKWGEDVDTINRFFYEEGLRLVEEGHPEPGEEIDEEDDDEDDEENDEED